MSLISVKMYRSLILVDCLHVDIICVYNQQGKYKIILDGFNVLNITSENNCREISRWETNFEGQSQ